MTTPINLPPLRDTELASVHRTTGPLRRALMTVPVWVAAAERLEHLTSIRPARRNVASIDVELEALPMSAVDERATLNLDEVDELASKVTARNTVAAGLAGAFEAATRSYVADLDSALLSNTSAVYASLTEQLVDVISRARPVSDVIDADAEQAITADRVDAWQTANELRTEFRSIRAAHSTLRQRTGWHVTRPGYDEIMYLHNPRAVFANYGTDETGDDEAPSRPPWPDSGIGGGELIDAWFAFLVTNPAAEPWAPSPKQVDDITAKLSATPVTSLLREDERTTHVRNLRSAV